MKGLHEIKPNKKYVKIITTVKNVLCDLSSLSRGENPP